MREDTKDMLTFGLFYAISGFMTGACVSGCVEERDRKACAENYAALRDQAIAHHAARWEIVDQKTGAVEFRWNDQIDAPRDAHITVKD